MKDFITSIASIILLMIFVMQFATNQAVYTKLVQTEGYVSLLRDSAEDQGRILPADVQRLKKSVAPILDCKPDEIRVDTHLLESGKEGYDISIPIKNIIGAAKLLGISQEENETEFHFQGIILGKEKDIDEKQGGKSSLTEEAKSEEHDNDDGNNDSILCPP